MNDGFFSSSKLESYNRRKPLPPKLNISFPPKEEKKKTVVVPKTNIPQLLLDIECFPNYFLAKFMRLEDGRILSFEKVDDLLEFDSKKVEKLIDKYEIITFNGNTYDIPMLRLAMTGASNKKLKKASDKLILSNMSSWRFEKHYNLSKLTIKHVDIIELCPGVVSLKIYGGRLHCEKMQDLPYEDDVELTNSEMNDVDDYCENDLKLTKLIVTKLTPRIELRREMSKRYKIDLLSKSDAQIAEAVILAEIGKIKKDAIEKREIEELSFLYQVPDFIKFDTPILQDALEIVTTKHFDVFRNGNIAMPYELEELQVKIGKSTYNLGMGGLHSKEKAAYHVANKDYSIYDWDVSSYYPMIILRLGLYPKQLGKEFLIIYQNIVDERLEAKHNKDEIKANVLKIVVNGSFGKFGSPYSYLYSPELMVQVTVTGQLSLLMLIEMLEKRGLSVISGNTDGIVIECPESKKDLMHRIIKHWKKITGFEMEETKYAGLFSRDVNNYIAIKENGDVKLKGCFRPADLDKNPENDIRIDAMIEYLKHGTPFEETIRKCTDIRKFLTVRTVKGGALKDGKYLGKAVRWYHAEGEYGSINYCVNGNQVALTQGCKPLMNLNVDFPTDIDYQWYVNACYKIFG